MSARKFASTPVNVFEVEVHDNILDQAERKLSVGALASHEEEPVSHPPEKIG